MLSAIHPKIPIAMRVSKLMEVRLFLLRCDLDSRSCLVSKSENVQYVVTINVTSKDYASSSDEVDFVTD